MATSVAARCATAALGFGILVGMTGCAAPTNVAGAGDLTVTETATETVTEPLATVVETPTEIDVQPPTEPQSWSAEDKNQDPEGANDLVVEDIQVGTHDGHDRVVYILSGEGMPGYSVSFVDKAVQDGSGFVHDTGDDKVILVKLNGMTMPLDPVNAVEFSGSPVQSAGDIVNQIIYDNWFEGSVRSFITIKPTVTDPVFAVSLVDHPTRVIVDVAPAASVTQ